MSLNIEDSDNMSDHNRLDSGMEQYQLEGTNSYEQYT